MTFAHNPKDPWTQIAAWVFRIAGEIRHGKVEITFHDARVVQFEVTEKFRSPRGAAVAQTATKRSNGGTGKRLTEPPEALSPHS